MRERFQSRSSLFSQNRAILLNWPSDSSSTEIRLLAVLLSVFSSQMQAISQMGCGVLCAEMGVNSWHILVLLGVGGAGEVSEP